MAVVLLAAAVLHARRQALRHDTESERLLAQANVATVWVLGMLGWVVLFELLIGFRTLREIPMLWLTCLWPIALLGFDLRLLQHQTLEHESRRVKSTMTLETNAISGLAFALGGMLATNMGRDFARTASPILSVVSLLCLAFVLPTPSAQTHTPVGVTILAAQKVCLTYCVGLLSAAVVLNLAATYPLGALRVEEYKKALATAPPANAPAAAEGVAVATGLGSAR